VSFRRENNVIELCHSCTQLETWHSKLHDSKLEVCTSRHLINPSEIKCSEYEEVEEDISYLCRTCTKLELWTSKLYALKSKSDKKKIVQKKQKKYVHIVIYYDPVKKNVVNMKK
jgi:hypothetical protein